MIGIIADGDIMTELDDCGYIGFELKKQGVSEYRLEDGSRVKLIDVVLKIIKDPFKKDPNGMLLNVTNLTTVYSPKELKGSPSKEAITRENLQKSIKNNDMNFTPVKEEWSEYELDNGSKVRLKTILTGVSSTSLYDPYGEPIYLMQMQELNRVIPKQEIIQKTQ